MLITNILLGIIIYFLIIIFGALCKLDRYLEATDNMAKLMKLYNELKPKVEKMKKDYDGAKEGYGPIIRKVKDDKAKVD